MDLQLTGKIAFVSGSTAGIGLAIAERLGLEGAENECRLASRGEIARRLTGVIRRVLGVLVEGHRPRNLLRRRVDPDLPGEALHCLQRLACHLAHRAIRPRAAKRERSRAGSLA